MTVYEACARGLSEAGGLASGNPPQGEQRLQCVFESLKGHLCFRCGQMEVTFEFDDGGPTLDDVLTDLLARETSGLC